MRHRNSKLTLVLWTTNSQKKIKQWLERPEAERDYNLGALYLLKLSGNQILYKNIVANIANRHTVVDYQLQKYYNFRVAALTHAQVEEMSTQVETITEEHHLTDEASTIPEDDRRTGKRADHDSLPDDVKAKFIENLSILQRMRELHLRLRSLSLDSATCPDSERYPFLKELISLDKKLHANWEAYDTYVIGQSDKVKGKTTSRKKSPRHS